MTSPAHTVATPSSHGWKQVENLPISSSPWSLAKIMINGEEAIIAVCAEHPPYIISNNQARELKL